MSKSGMFLVADGEHDVGEQLQVSFEDGGDKIELQMEVMWCGKPEGDAAAALGVRIVGFGKGEHAYERFVSRHLEGDEPERSEPGAPGTEAEPEP